MTRFAAAFLLFLVFVYVSGGIVVYSTGNPMIGFAAALLLLAAFTYLSGWLAGRRGRSAKLWYWMGAIFGPVAFLAVALLPPVLEPQ